MPDATEDAGQAEPDVATDDVLHRVHTDDPALTAEGGTGEITEDHTGIEGRIGDQTNVAATGCPSVVDTAEEHRLEDQQQAAHTKKNQVVADDVGHLVLIAPILREEGGIVLQNFGATQGVIQAAEAEHGGTDQVQHTDHEEGVEVNDLTTGTHAIAKGGDVGEQDQTLFVHGLIEGEVAHLEQHHRASPEHHQAGVGDVGAQQATREVDQAGIARPPGITGGVEVFAPDRNQTGIKGRFHGAEPLQGRRSFREAGQRGPSRRADLRSRGCSWCRRSRTRGPQRRGSPATRSRRRAG